MRDQSQALQVPHTDAHVHSHGEFFRSLVIALTAFLSLVDLFATQAILPSLTKHYGVTPGAMGLASNASTFGMLVSGLAVGYFSGSIDRRLGILVSLVLLAIPTTLLAYAPNLAGFATLRVIQGLCMASAFTLTLAYLGEHYSAEDSASALAAYIQLLFLRRAQSLGCAACLFHGGKKSRMQATGSGMRSHFAAWIMHLQNPSLRASCGCTKTKFISERANEGKQDAETDGKARRRCDGAWLCLFCLRAVYCHDSARGSCC
jgi:sugar phosphate permease